MLDQCEASQKVSEELNDEELESIVGGAGVWVRPMDLHLPEESAENRIQTGKIPTPAAVSVGVGIAAAVVWGVIEKMKH